MDIQAIIFDVGGVLLRTYDRSSRQTWEQKLGLADWQADEIVFNSEMSTKAQRGEISEEALWQWVGAHLNLSPPELAQFRRDFWAGDEMDDALIDYIRRLTGRYQTAIISNAMDGLREALTDTFAIADAFDLIVVSAEEGIMKPDPTIFRRALRRLDRQPQEAMFIDDFAHNVAGARDVGMYAIHFTPETDLVAELARLGVDGD